MADETVPVCRLCLEVVYDGKFQDAESIIIILQNVLPDLNFSVSSHPLICKKCTETVQKSFNFKSACLETEKQLQNYRPNESSTIYLEEVVNNKCSENEVKIEKIDKGKICRFCLETLEGEKCIQLGVIEQDMLRRCLPELDLSISENPIICATCLECLQNQFNFVMICSDVEERIKKYCSVHGTNSNGQVNLHDILDVSVKTHVDELLKDVKTELEDKDSPNTEQSNMEYEEIFIKDEVNAESAQEDSIDISDGDTSSDWLDGYNPDADYEMRKQPHELDHDYITILNNGLSKTKFTFTRLTAKSYKMKHYVKPRREIQALKVLKKTIVRLEKKLKYYQDRYQKASEKLRNIRNVLQELRNKNLISEDAYREIMACK